jgi:hypothetical protein
MANTRTISTASAATAAPVSAAATTTARDTLSVWMPGRSRLRPHQGNGAGTGRCEQD